jgi:molecular chaperone DnaJ
VVFPGSRIPDPDTFTTTMDFYVILGLGPDASAAEIKRAYRRLSRRYHPGVNPGDRTAQEMFTRISEAYEVLMDPRRRQEYDSGGSPSSPPAQAGVPQFTEFDFSVQAHGAQASTFSELFAEVLNPIPASGAGRPEAGADLHATLAVPFDAQFKGDERQVVVTRQVSCAACDGTGLKATTEGRCARCDGRGQTRWARGHMVFVKECVACAGTGRRRAEACGACLGHGRAVRSEAVTVRVPPGIQNGARVRVPERGNAGRHGGTTGDLYVTIQVAPHPVFRREGDDLLCTIPVAVHEAVLGARIEIPTFNEKIRLNLPPGTQGGRQFRARGRGFPTVSGDAGDLIAEVQIVLPSAIDERSRELIREFGRLNPEDVRKDFTGQPGKRVEPVERVERVEQQ